MTELNDMYYLTILLKAFRESYTERALRNAFKEIVTKGSTPEYREAYTHFLDLIKKGVADLASNDPDVWDTIKEQAFKDIMLSLATDRFPGSKETQEELIKAITANPKLNSIYKELLESLGKDEKVPFEFILEKNDVDFATISIPDTETAAIVHRIGPGTYILRHANGRVLWEDTISSSQVIWQEAYPHVNYSMVADTGDAIDRATLRVSLLDGEITISITPGLESGTMKVTINE